jgi:hypothetical protein
MQGALFRHQPFILGGTMKKLCLIFLLAWFASTHLLGAEIETKNLVWSEALVQSNGESSVIGWYERELTKRIGFYTLVQVANDGYQQFYVGPFVKPTEWLQIGIGFGRENMPYSTRRNAFVSIDTELLTCFGTFETGGSGPWHRAHCVYNISQSVSAGVMTERFLGHAPRIEYRLNKNVSVWVAYFPSPTEGKSLVMTALDLEHTF